MAISQSLLPEFDHETAHTRRTLERVPDDRFEWKPHQKSMSMGRLAGHLAEVLDWGVTVVEHDAFDMAPPGGTSFKPPVLGAAAEVVDLFDKNRAAARAAIAGASDEHLLKTWSLLSGGKTILSMPRIAVLRAFVMSHMIHHRAQLGVYLRLNDLPVPAIYGPSADETGG